MNSKFKHTELALAIPQRQIKLLEASKSEITDCMTMLLWKIIHVSVSYFIALLWCILSVHILGIHAKCQIYLNLNHAVFGKFRRTVRSWKEERGKRRTIDYEDECGPWCTSIVISKNGKGLPAVSKRVVLCLLSSGKAERKTVQIVSFSKKYSKNYQKARRNRTSKPKCKSPACIFSRVVNPW